MRMTLDLLHEFANTEVFCLFHNCMWQSRHSEVDVYVLVLHEQTRWLFKNKSPCSNMICVYVFVCVFVLIRTSNRHWHTTVHKVSPFFHWRFSSHVRNIFNLLNTRTRLLLDNGRTTRPRRFATHQLAPSDTDYQLSPTQPIVRRSETAPAIRVKPTAVRINQHSGVRVPRNKQLSPSLPHAIIVSVCCTTTQSFSAVRFCVLSRTRSMAALPEKRTDDWASPIPPLRSPIRHDIQGYDPEDRITRVDCPRLSYLPSYQHASA